MSNFEEYPNPLDHLVEFTDRMNETKAMELRTDILRLAHEAFSVFRNLDAEAADEVHTKEPISRFLKLDILASPALTQDEFVDALSYTLIRSKERAPGDTFGADRIHVYLPVSSDFHMGQGFSEIPDYEDMDQIYVMFEKDKSDGTHVRRFAITRDDVFEYAVLTDPDYEDDASDIFERDVHYMLTDTQNLNMLMISQLIEDHRNFKVQQYETA